MTLSEIPTPALIVDVKTMERNIRRMSEYFASRSCKLRPHFKAHKTPEIARRQLAAGSCTGLTCATIDEAEVAAKVSNDILIANEIVDTEKSRRVATLARHVAVMAAIDSLAGLEQLSTAARAANVTIDVLVDLNVGQNRCGVAPGDDAVALGRQVPGRRGIRLRGVMGYEGHAVGIHDRAEREREVRRSMNQLASTAKAFVAAGLRADVVSGGGTGSYDISSDVEGITEIQAGSYALMDSDYGCLGMPFEQALFVLGTVVSRPVPERCVIDAGHKACTKDHGHPLVKDMKEATVLALNDEHSIISLPPSSTIKVGDRLALIPSHIDPTMNLHDVVYALEDGRVVEVWPIEARGYTTKARRD
jgi:D-serine deaminase-like pyridoxal phosphate-dependent protein